MIARLALAIDRLAAFAALKLWVYAALLQTAVAIVRGFATTSSPRLAVIEGMISAAFWLGAAFLPMLSNVRKTNELLLDALNAIAAGATGAAVMAGTGTGWAVAFGVVSQATGNTTG